MQYFSRGVPYIGGGLITHGVKGWKRRRVLPIIVALGPFNVFLQLPQGVRLSFFLLGKGGLSFSTTDLIAKEIHQIIICFPAYDIVGVVALSNCSFCFGRGGCLHFFSNIATWRFLKVEQVKIAPGGKGEAVSRMNIEVSPPKTWIKHIEDWSMIFPKKLISWGFAGSICWFSVE